MIRPKSQMMFEEAKRYIPGGVNSPVRAFKSVNDTPFYVKAGKGACLFDVDGNGYVDYVSSWGAIILGHSDEGLTNVVKAALEDGTSFGACHPYEIEIAKLIINAFPSMDLVRLTSSGTEATMSAIRLARGFTGKNGVIKFRGCYHGHVDSLLVKAGSGLATFGVPDSAGIDKDTARHTYVADFNHLDSLLRIVEQHRDDIACLILEPIMGNMGLILPQDGFLKQVQEVCRDNHILLICDEVITGFRVAYGGAQQVYGIDPDITCLGKIIGGGFPIGAFGGKRPIMEHIAPLGPVYQAGTLSGNPIAVRAGIYALTFLRDHGRAYDLLSEKVESLKNHMVDASRRAGIPYVINSVTGMFTGFFCDEPVSDYETALRSNRPRYEKYFKLMLDQGVFFAPSPFEASMVTLSHGDGEIERTLAAFDRVVAELQDI
jgi:glutamate-1-semialdehyde 2,1-aminomutase